MVAEVSELTTILYQMLYAIIADYCDTCISFTQNDGRFGWIYHEGCKNQAPDLISCRITLNRQGEMVLETLYQKSNEFGTVSTLLYLNNFHVVIE